MEFTIEQLEAKERINELRPLETLKDIGFNPGMSFCDIGAGSGIFAFQAAKISTNNIYALEINDNLIRSMRKTKEVKGLEHLHVEKVISEILPVDNDSCDMIMMTALFHGIEDKVSLLQEVSRIIKRNGCLVIIEFHKKNTKNGPPIMFRLNPLEVKEILNLNGFRTKEEKNLGDNYYLLTFRKEN